LESLLLSDYLKTSRAGVKCIVTGFERSPASYFYSISTIVNTYFGGGLGMVFFSPAMGSCIVEESWTLFQGNLVSGIEKTLSWSYICGEFEILLD
jgi:hypothetical protein